MVGLVVAVAYVATIGLTLGLHPGRVRPLYEGFTPPSNYHWVNPPKIDAAANQKPTVTHATVKLGPQGSSAAGVTTDDAQLSLGLSAGAIPRHGSDTSVAVTVTPLDPASVAALTSPFRANGNVYDIAMLYQPSGAAVTTLAGAGASMVLVTPEVGKHLFLATSSAGPWTGVSAHVIPPTDLTLGASIHRTGYYVGGTTLPPLAYAQGSSISVVAISAAVGGLAVVVIVAAMLLSRRRRRRASPS